MHKNASSIHKLLKKKKLKCNPLCIFWKVWIFSNRC